MNCVTKIQKGERGNLIQGSSKIFSTLKGHVLIHPRRMDLNHRALSFMSLVILDIYQYQLMNSCQLFSLSPVIYSVVYLESSVSKLLKYTTSNQTRDKCRLSALLQGVLNNYCITFLGITAIFMHSPPFSQAQN